MYAIIATGGKQFKVEKDQIIKVEKLDANKWTNYNRGQQRRSNSRSRE